MRLFYTLKKGVRQISTIQTAIRVFDGMTPGLRSMTNALDLMLNTFEATQRASGRAIDTEGIRAAREEIARASATWQEIDDNIQGVNRSTRTTTSSQDRYTDSVRQSENAASNLWNKIKGIASAVGLLAIGKKGLDLSDELSQTKARLDMINDGQQSTAELQQMIFESAQRSRGEYQATADAVSKMGLMASDAFANNQELVAFGEQLNKQFAIAGTSQEGIDAAMLQLTQAMSSGVLRGEELNSVFEQAPTIIQSIADYMGVPIGQIRALASEGQLSATIVKNALLSTADETNAKFNSMPMTFGQIFTKIKNQALMAFQPILEKLSSIANSAEFQTFIANIIAVISMIGSVAASAFDALLGIADAISNNWSMIAPIVMGVVTAFGLYKASVMLSAIATAVLTGAKMLAVPVYSLLTGATMAETAAQWGLNTALYSCPLVWIIILIIALIAIFYAVIGAINHFAGTSISATGVICGAFATAGAFIGNILIAAYNLVINVIVIIHNVVADLANFIGNVFNDPINSICRLFFGLADTVLSILQALASAIDTIFGFNLAGTVQGWRDSLGGWVDETFGEGDKIIEKLNAEDYKIDRLNYGDAQNAGYSFGENLEDSFSFDSLFSDASAGKDFAEGLTDYDISPFDESMLGSTDKNTKATADNTEKISDSMSASEEDLKYLRDIAERETVNRFTTARLDLNFQTENHINSDLDLDGVCDYMVDRTYQSMLAMAEGVH